MPRSAPPTPGGSSEEERTDLLVSTLAEAFAPLQEADPAAFRGKYRKMAADPHSFYRGSACVFYADVTGQDDPFATGRAGRIWVHGDLHAENFGTYLAADGRLVFDVNDFDEAYLGRFTWDLQRFAASLALLCWQKALPEDDVRALVGDYLDAYLDQVDDYRRADAGELDRAEVAEFALHLDNTEGPVHDALVQARSRRRADLLDDLTVPVEGVRRLRDGAGVRRLEDGEREAVVAAYERFVDRIPAAKRMRRDLFYDLRDVAGKSGFGIGSAGLPAYNLLIEGYSQALDDDVLLSMKQANVPAVSRFVDSAPVERHFDHQAHRTVVSQRALQAHTDPLLGHTEIDGVGYVVSELSPYEVDLDWGGLIEPEQIRQVVGLLGRATAKVHCASDEDSDEDLVDFQVEDAVAEAVGDRRRELHSWLADFAVGYAERVRADHALFVEAFRAGRIGVSATSR